MKIRIYLILIFIIAPNYSYATQSMEDFWESLGGMSNVSEGKFVKGQKAGHLSLGSVQIRSNIKNVQLASARLPSVKAGCGGIDFFAGGFSFIDSDQLIALLKSIGSNAAGVLFQMAIDSLSPQMGSQLKYFQNLIRNINELNINSCQAANSLIKDFSGTMGSIKKYGCEVASNTYGTFKDSAASFEGCTSGGKADSTLDSADDNIKNAFPAEDMNIAWKSLKDSGLINLDSPSGIEMAELLMTLSGTIIITDAKNSPQINKYYPKIEESKAVGKMLEGGELEILECYGANPYDKCLNVQYSNINISKESSYLGRVNKAINEISEALKNDNHSELSDQTYKLLSFSSLPILNILRVNQSYFKENNTENDSMADFVALDLLYGYFESVNRTMLKAASKYNKAPYDKLFKEFFANQKNIKSVLDIKRRGLGDKFSNHLKILERTAKIEEMLIKNGQGQIKFGM